MTPLDSRYFARKGERFESDTAYVQSFVFSNVANLVGHTGHVRRAESGLFTVTKCLDNVKIGVWIELSRRDAEAMVDWPRGAEPWLRRDAVSALPSVHLNDRPHGQVDAW